MGVRLKPHLVRNQTVIVELFFFCKSEPEFKTSPLLRTTGYRLVNSNMSTHLDVGDTEWLVLRKGRWNAGLD